MLCVKKSRIIWNGHANIEKQRSFFNKYAIKRNIIAIIRLCEILYKEITQDGISDNSGLPNLIVLGLTIRLNKKYIPNDVRSGIAPKKSGSHLYFRYPKSPFPHSAWLIVSMIIIYLFSLYLLSNEPSFFVFLSKKISNIVNLGNGFP